MYRDAVAKAAVGLLTVCGVGCASEDWGNVPDARTTHRELSNAEESPQKPTTEKSPAEARRSRQMEVDEFHRERSKDWRIVDTRQSPSGQVIDYVDAATMYPDSPDAPFVTPPSEKVKAATSVLETKDDDGPFLGQTEIQVEPSLKPPPGTIPVLREQFSAYVEDGGSYTSLEDFLQHLEPPANATARDRLYGYQFGGIPNDGTFGTINLWKYSEVTNANAMSLMQGALGCPGIYNGAIATVEAGFNVFPQIYGDSNLHFFTFFTTNGYSAYGHYAQSYNEVYKGFIRAAGSPFFPGSIIASNTLSILNGSQYECPLMFDRNADGNIYIYACNVYMGYYPTQRSTSVSSTRRINFGDLGDFYSCKADWYGEIFGRTGGAGSAWGIQNMGSGQFPDMTLPLYKSVAYIRNTQYWGLGASNWTDLPDNPLWSSAPGSGFDWNCYDVSAIANYPVIGRGFYLGGPGYGIRGFKDCH